MSNWHCSWPLTLRRSQIWGCLFVTLCPSPLSVMEQTLPLVLSQHTETCGTGTAKAMCHLQSTWKCYNSWQLPKSQLQKFWNRQVILIQEKTLLDPSRPMDSVHFHQCWMCPLVKKMGVNWIKILSQASWAELELIWLVHLWHLPKLGLIGSCITFIEVKNTSVSAETEAGGNYGGKPGVTLHSIKFFGGKECWQ